LDSSSRKIEQVSAVPSAYFEDRKCKGFSRIGILSNTARVEGACVEYLAACPLFVLLLSANITVNDPTSQHPGYPVENSNPLFANGPTYSSQATAG
jgi:hypothetical protein